MGSSRPDDRSSGVVRAVESTNCPLPFKVVVVLVFARQRGHRFFFLPLRSFFLAAACMLSLRAQACMWLMFFLLIQIAGPINSLVPRAR